LFPDQAADLLDGAIAIACIYRMDGPKVASMVKFGLFYVCGDQPCRSQGSENLHSHMAESPNSHNDDARVRR
jgi:hypothetical protein